MNTSTFILIIVFVLAVGGLSLQYLKGIGKIFQSNQENSQYNPASLQDQQKQHAQDIEEQRRAYMESIKQRMRDSQH